MLMRDFNVTAICCTPSYFMHLVDRAAKWHEPARNCPSASAYSEPEPWTDSMRRHIEAESGIEAYDIYGSPRSLVPASPWSARAAPGSTFSRTTSTPKSSNPDTGEPLPKAPRANWCSPP